jgi:hypothetical protein
VQVAINVAIPGETIHICAGEYLEHDISIDKDLTLIGAGDGPDAATNTILNANGSGRVVFIDVGVAATLHGLRITSGSTSDDGAGVYHQGELLTMIACTVTGNTAGNGGGIYNNGGTVMLDDTAVSGNTPNQCAPAGSVAGCDG